MAAPVSLPTSPIPLDAGAVVRRLRELDERSGGRRVAWTDVWRDERDRFDAIARELVPQIRIGTDPFANRWYVLDGQSDETVLLGSHTDCVPDGGWLDGVLGVHAGLAVLVALGGAGTAPRRSVVLVDWADEEGVRLGRSLLGSSAACGTLAPEAFAALSDADGAPAAEVVAPYGFEIQRLGERVPALDRVTAALELHIEQGPVLETTGRMVAAVAGCLGVARGRYVVHGRSGHAGATPMDLRADPVRAAAEAIAALSAVAERGGGLATVGHLTARPGIATAVAGECAFTLDVRHHDPSQLSELSAAAEAEIGRAATDHGCEVDHAALLSIAPVDFDPALVTRAIRATDGGAALRSGPLHDAAALAGAGIPTGMVFAPSTGGVSHTRGEDTPEAALLQAIESFGALAIGLVGL
jgi:hydantoinase/carbamoylase family amidase